MKKVLVNVPIDAETKKRFEDISDQYCFVYREDREEDKKDVQIIIGNYPPARLKEFEKLEWIQSGAVGIDAYIKKGILKDGVLLTNAVDVHTKEVAEHTLAVLLAMVKKLYVYHDDQRAHIWRDEGRVKEIAKLKVAIIGLGNIGKHLAKNLKALGVYVIGVKQTMIEKPEYIDELYLKEDLDKAISDVDAVVAILPGNAENAGLFTLDTFKKMRSDTVFLNVGRGNLYSPETLNRVLDEKIIAGIYSDVFYKEPLLKDDPLWDKERMLITPHAAGSYHLQSAFEAFLDLAEENLRRYIENKELKNIVTKRED